MNHLCTMTNDEITYTLAGKHLSKSYHCLQTHGDLPLLPAVPQQTARAVKPVIRSRVAAAVKSTLAAENLFSVTC